MATKSPGKPHISASLEAHSRITEFYRPKRFVDEQIDGPFRSWWHEHRFGSAGSATKMTDLVQYELPLGRIGEWSEG